MGTTEKKQRWGLVLVAFLVAIINLLANQVSGSKNSIYTVLWLYIAYLASRDELEKISLILKIIITLQIIIVAISMILSDNETYLFMQFSSKEEFFTVVSISITIKILFLLYIKSEIVKKTDQSKHINENLISKTPKIENELNAKVVQPIKDQHQVKKNDYLKNSSSFNKDAQGAIQKKK